MTDIVSEVRQAISKFEHETGCGIIGVATLSIHREALLALCDAADAGLAKREPATEEVIEAKFEKSFYVHPEALDDFAEGWCEAERHHGIRKEDGK